MVGAESCIDPHPSLRVVSATFKEPYPDSGDVYFIYKEVSRLLLKYVAPALLHRREITLQLIARVQRFYSSQVNIVY